MAKRPRSDFCPELNDVPADIVRSTIRGLALIYRGRPACMNVRRANVFYIRARLTMWYICLRNAWRKKRRSEGPAFQRIGGQNG